MSDLAFSNPQSTTSGSKTYALRHYTGGAINENQFSARCNGLASGSLIAQMSVGNSAFSEGIRLTLPMILLLYN